MAKIRLRIEGRLGTISLRTLALGIQSQLRILNDLDSAISPQHRPTLEWVLTGLEAGSAAVEAESISKQGAIDVGPQVVGLFARGLGQIEGEGTTPPYFLESTIKSAHKLLALIGKDGAMGLEVYTPQFGAVSLSLKGLERVKNLLPTRYTSIGSVEGRVEMISIHGSPRFIVYLSLTNKGVTCKVADEQIQEVKDMLGMRVNVQGAMNYNSMGEPVSVKAEDMRRLREDRDLPCAKDLTGSDPELTGSLTTSEYLEEIRGRIQKTVS